DGKLVTAHACDDVEFARATAQALADELEQLVADMMAERVVDALEVIEGEALAALDALDLVVELFEQKRPVWKIGEGVMPRHMRDPFLGALTLGDILV